MESPRSARESAPFDSEAVAQLLRHHAAELRAYLEKVNSSHPEIDADDILQDVWIAAFRSIGTVRPKEETHLVQWLKALANRKLLDAIKSGYALKRGGQERKHSFSRRQAERSIDKRTPSREFAAMEIAQLVRLALSRLPGEQREAVHYHLEGRAMDDIARLMRKTPVTVRSLVYRGVRNLRQFLPLPERF